MFQSVPLHKLRTLLWPIELIAFEIRWVEIALKRESRTPLFGLFSPFWSLIVFGLGIAMVWVGAEFHSFIYELGLAHTEPGLHSSGSTAAFLVVLYLLGAGLRYHIVTVERERPAQLVRFMLLGAMAGALFMFTI